MDAVWKQESLKIGSQKTEWQGKPAALISNSRAMRFFPYSGWSPEMRRMKSMCVSGIRGRPGPGLDFFRQYSLNFFFRHLMTVSGFTMTSREVQSCPGRGAPRTAGPDS